MSKDINEVVAKNVIAARKHRGQSRRALAIAAGISPNSVKNIEEPDVREPNMRGASSTRLDILDKLAQYLGCETWQLLTVAFDPNEPLAEHPISKREKQLHEQIEANFKKLTNPDPA